MFNKKHERVINNYYDKKPESKTPSIMNNALSSYKNQLKLSKRYKKKQ